MIMRVFSVSNKAEVRKRLSRGSVLLQTSQLQPRTGTPFEVPVPKNVKYLIGSDIFISHLLRDESQYQTSLSHHAG